MTAVSSRAVFERRRTRPIHANNSVRRSYDLLRSSLPGLGCDARLVEGELIDALSASRSTVRSVLQLLAEQGLVTRGRKVGTVVRGSTVLPIGEVMTVPEFSDDVTIGCHGKVIESRVIAAPPIVRERLDLASRASVLMTDGLLYKGPAPLAVAVCYLALPAGAPPAAPGVPPDAVAFLEGNLHVDVGDVASRIAAVAADSQTATMLGIADGAPILWCEDLIHDVEGRPRALSQVRFRGDCVTFTAAARRRSAPT